MSKKYIPKNLDDCFVELNKILESKEIEYIKNMLEKDIILLHNDLGRYLRNIWGLWSESRLCEWFNQQGVHHADDMSGIILESFWKKLNLKPIKLKSQIKFYKNYWKKHKK